MSENEKPTMPKDENEVWEAIAAFEQIVDVMPEDRASLEALIHAYAHVGDQVKAREYLIRYGHVIVEQKDLHVARDLVEQLSPMRDDSNVVALLDRLEMMLGVGPGSSSEVATGGDAPVVEAAVASAPVHVEWGDIFEVGDELQLAWQLFDAGEMTQDEYSMVVQDLSDMVSASGGVTVSVFHILEVRTSKALDRLLGYVAKEAPAPLVSLECFGLPISTVYQIPQAFMVRHGVMLFEQMGKEGMLVMMNPYNTRLRDYIQNRLGMTCHVYLAEPRGFDAALTRAAQLQMEAERAAAEGEQPESK